MIHSNTPMSSLGSLSRDLRVLGGDAKDGGSFMLLLCRQSLFLEGKRGTVVARLDEDCSFPLMLSAKDPSAQIFAHDVSEVSKETSTNMCHRDRHAHDMPQVPRSMMLQPT